MRTSRRKPGASIKFTTVHSGVIGASFFGCTPALFCLSILTTACLFRLAIVRISP